jgi:hypothetical protein
MGVILGNALDLWSGDRVRCLWDSCRPKWTSSLLHLHSKPFHADEQPQTKAVVCWLQKNTAVLGFFSKAWRKTFSVRASRSKRASLLKTVLARTALGE